jgi:hypothetical protein
MGNQGERLLEALAEYEVSQAILRAFGELCYTASERSLWDNELRGDELALVYKLAKMAEKYAESGGVPDDLRM